MTTPDRQEAERFVNALYQGLLRRAPDQNGIAHFVDSMQRGRSPAEVAEAFATCDEFRSLNPAAPASTVKLFVPPGHFYSPIVDPTEARQYFADRAALPAPESLPGIALDRAGMVSLWHSLVPFFASMPFATAEKGRHRYRFDNPSYSWGDGSVLHAMLRHFRPQRLIEIGSGWSSACTLDTVEAYLDNECELTLIEPFPRLLLELAGGAIGRVRLIDKPVQAVPAETFAALRDGDILFIDSTHILRTGSDVCHELFEILPRLAPGVIVHLHDMFWPFEYPRAWAVDDNRSWNEVYAVRAFLTGNAQWRILMFNDYMAQFERPLIAATHPDFLRNSGGALWLQRV